MTQPPEIKGVMSSNPSEKAWAPALKAATAAKQKYLRIYLSPLKVMLSEGRKTLPPRTVRRHYAPKQRLSEQKPRTKNLRPPAIHRFTLAPLPSSILRMA